MEADAPKRRLALPGDTSPFKLEVLEGPKRQHYLSRFYCEGFARREDGLLHVYDRDLREYRRQSPINTAVEAHFYTFLDTEDRRRFDIEHMLSKIEALAAPAIRVLDEAAAIPDEQRDALALFVGFLCTRTPEFMAMAQGVIGAAHVKKVMAELQTEEQVAARLLAIADEVPEARKVTAKEMLEHIHGGKFKLEVEVDRQALLAKAVELAPQIALMLYFQRWIVLHPGDEAASFTTCDSPVFVPQEPAGTIVAAPLSQSSCLIALPGPPDLRFETIGRDLVRRLNRACTANTYRFCMARDEPLLRSVVKATAIDAHPWVPRHERGQADAAAEDQPRG